MMIKKTDLSIPGAIIIIVSQLVSSFKNSENISNEIKEFRKEFQQALIDRETYFVRKTELASVSKKIDKVNLELVKIHEHIKVIDNKNNFFTSLFNPTPKKIGFLIEKRGPFRHASQL